MIASTKYTYSILGPDFIELNDLISNGAVWQVCDKSSGLDQFNQIQYSPNIVITLELISKI